MLGALRGSTLARLGLVGLLALAALAVVAGTSARDGSRPANPGSGDVVSLGDVAAPGARTAAVRDPEEALSHPDAAAAAKGPKAVSPKDVGASSDDGISPGAPSDAEVRRELRELYGSASAAAGRAEVDSKGDAEAPLGAPDAVRQVIAGGNAIARFPYVWGGGHGSFEDSGYDCSGSVSYALAAAGLLDAPITSGAFERYGEPGKGRWITIYANGGHVFMVVAGLRFDTSGRSGSRGSRWQAAPRSTAGFTAVHPPGL
ncbi:MAG TPA: hypothetical protein VF520_12905 [Thermoleophilaceae bacterium]